MSLVASLVTWVRSIGRRFPALRRLGQQGPLARVWTFFRLRELDVPADLNHELKSRHHIDGYGSQQVPGLLSFVTTVWNTDPDFVDCLAQSVVAQVGGTHFEWLILDNGTSSETTLACMQRLSSLPFVRLVRVEANLGIIGGMRWCLENARGRYILPLDSDDYLHPDCVRIFTDVIQRHGFPALLYSDEDKLIGSSFRDPYFKPDWDPVLFCNSCYIAHLCAIDRELALKLDAYSDPSAEGCHDWDTFTRFFSAGHVPFHVPELLYSWRMHPQSTSAVIGSKPYVFESHRKVLRRWVDSRPNGSRFQIDASPLFQGTPDWWIRRDKIDAPAMLTMRMAPVMGGQVAVDSLRPIESNGYPCVESLRIPDSANAAQLLEALNALGKHDPDTLVHLFWDAVVIDQAEWAWEALALFELFPDCVMVGGRLFDRNDRIADAGAYLGYGRGCDSPDVARPRQDPGYFAQMWKQHSVNAVSSAHSVIRLDFLLSALRESVGQDALSVSLPYLGAWLGAVAAERGKRVVYSPFVSGIEAGSWRDRVTDYEQQLFNQRFAKLIPDTRFLSRHLGLQYGQTYVPVDKSKRDAHLAGLRAGGERDAERTQELSRG